MIQLIVECSGAEPLGFHHDAVTGVRARLCGRMFQILEGPEGAVMLALAVLADDARHMARTTVSSRSFSRWQSGAVLSDELPDEVTRRLSEFAAATGGEVQEPNVHQAIDFLSCLVETRPLPAMSSGRRPISKVGGQSGKRAWIAV